MKLKALIVGLGNIGMGYDLNLSPDDYIITHARALQQHAKFELVGGVDINQENRNIFSEYYSCSVFSELSTALEKTKPDMVVIALPTEKHSEAIEMVFKFSQPSIILCEKPLSFSVADAKNIVAQCESNNCRLYVNYMRRSDPGIIEITKRLFNGEIKSPIKGVVWYSKGLFNNGSHFFNIIHSWFGEMEDFKIINSGRMWGDVDPEPDFQVSFDGSNITFLSAQEENFSHYTIELVATNGRLRIEHGGQKLIWQKAHADSVVIGYTVLSDIEEVVQSDMSKSQFNVIEQIVAELSGEESNLCTGSDAILTLETLEKIRVAL